MAKFEKRLEARRLRRRTWSLGDIAKHLAVSKSTVSLWCLDVPMTERQRERLKLKAIKAGLGGRLSGSVRNHQKKLDTIALYQKEGKKTIGKLSRREFLVAGAALYWGEGSKKGKLSLINSDPTLILFRYSWFRLILGIEKEEFMPRVFINEMHRPRIKKVIAFWSKLLKLSPSQFGNPVFIKVRQKKVYDNYDSYYGILALRVRRGTERRYKILGLIDALKVSI